MSTITNVATYSGIQNLLPIYQTSTTATITIYEEASGVTFTKTASPSTVYAGQGTVVTYTLTIVNSGVNLISATTITDVLNSRCTYVTGSAQQNGSVISASNITYTNNTLTIANLSLIGSGTTTITFEVVVN